MVPPPWVLLSPCFLLFLLVACTRPYTLLCPSVGWLVRRAAFFGPFRSCWVILGHFGSIWVSLGRFGHLGLARNLWAFLEKPQIFWGSSVFSFSVDVACLCTCVFPVCMGVCRGNVPMPIEPCVFFYISL